MNSVHYPTITPVGLAPLHPQTRDASPLRRDSTRKASLSKPHPNSQVQPHYFPQPASAEVTEISGVRKRRSSLPLIFQSRDDDVDVTSSKTGHSMAEVVSRMPVTEKSLAGEDLLKGRYNSGASNGQLATDASIPTIHIEDIASGQNSSEPSSQDAVSLNTRTIKMGQVDGAKAWGTPRDPQNHTLRVDSTSSDKLNDFLWATGQTGEQHPDEEQPEVVEESAVKETSITGSQSDDSDDDSDFDFDEGEDEMAEQREQDRRCRDTGAVYQRACQNLRIQPSPAFLRQCSLSTMDLRDVRLGPADVKPIAIAMVRDGRIYSLDLSSNDLGPIGVSYIAEMLQENSTLFDLNLSATNPGREGVKALSETLPHNRTLAYLRLEENGIEHTESHLLADVIRHVPTLQGLYLGHNRLGYRGGAAIASAIAQNNNLRTLDLQWNHIRRDSGAALIRALASNHCLRTLNLAWNGLGKEGCLALAHALPQSSTLRELDLTCNRVDLMSLGFLLKGVTRNTSLQSLRIGQNPLTTDGAKALIRAVASAPKLGISDIDIGGVPVDLEFTQMVASAQESRVLRVKHEEAVTLATSDRKREHDGTNLDRYDPVMVFFEYMKLDNLRVIDMFQFMDVKKKEKLSKGNIRDGLNTLKVPVTEHAIDVIFQKLDINKDGFVELDEMMKMQRDTARQIKLRQIKAKARNKEDEGLNAMRKILRDIIAKRKEDKEPPGRRDTSQSQSLTTTKTSVGGKKASVGGLQLTQARYSVTSSKRRGGRGVGGGGGGEEQMTSSEAEEEL